MKRLIFLCLILNTVSLLAQRKFDFIAGLEHKVSLSFVNASIGDNNGFSNSTFILNLGFGMQNKSLETRLFLSYGILANYGKKNYRILGFHEKGSFSFLSHLLGLKTQFIFLDFKKRFRPLITISGQTEIGSNYADGLLSSYFFPTEKPLPDANYYVPHLLFSKSMKFANFYQSTPFIGNLSLGCDIRLLDNLHLYASIGYGFRIMQTKYLEWKDGENYIAKLETEPIDTHFFHTLDFQLGLSYAFDIHKKKPKTTTP